MSWARRVAHKTVAYKAVAYKAVVHRTGSTNTYTYTFHSLNHLIGKVIVKYISLAMSTFLSKTSYRQCLSSKNLPKERL